MLLANVGDFFSWTPALIHIESTPGPVVLCLAVLVEARSGLNTLHSVSYTQELISS